MAVARKRSAFIVLGFVEVDEREKGYSLGGFNVCLKVKICCRDPGFGELSSGNCFASKLWVARVSDDLFSMD